jgi:ATP-binding cassette subfamily A (ABC1) protein 3
MHLTISNRKNIYILKGLNGAGKTSTFKMIIGENEPTRGDVFINGYSITAEQYQARKHLGYCPQHDR